MRLLNRTWQGGAPTDLWVTPLTENIPLMNHRIDYWSWSFHSFSHGQIRQKVHHRQKIRSKWGPAILWADKDTGMENIFLHWCHWREQSNVLQFQSFRNCPFRCVMPCSFPSRLLSNSSCKMQIWATVCSALLCAVTHCNSAGPMLKWAHTGEDSTDSNMQAAWSFSFSAHNAKLSLIKMKHFWTAENIYQIILVFYWAVFPYDCHMLCFLETVFNAV